MYVLEGKKLRQGRPFTHNGIQYPGNWLDLTSAGEKAAIGITWEADPAPFNSRFYFSVDNPREVADVKPSMLTEQDTTAHVLLAPTDWYVVRKYENSTAIPVGITSFRTAVRDTCESRKVAINGAADIPALVGVSTFGGMNWPNLKNYV
tara:strand:- start:202 stop:648 length:447 start_codon:yes stop_codon:yes gene_type:complete